MLLSKRSWSLRVLKSRRKLAIFRLFRNGRSHCSKSQIQLKHFLCGTFACRCLLQLYTARTNMPTHAHSATNTRHEGRKIASQFIGSRLVLSPIAIYLFCILFCLLLYFHFEFANCFHLLCAFALHFAFHLPLSLPLMVSNLTFHSNNLSEKC